MLGQLVDLDARNYSEACQGLLRRLHCRLCPSLGWRWYPFCCFALKIFIFSSFGVKVVNSSSSTFGVFSHLELTPVFPGTMQVTTVDLLLANSGVHVATVSNSRSLMGLTTVFVTSNAIYFTASPVLPSCCVYSHNFAASYHFHRIE